MGRCCVLANVSPHILWKILDVYIIYMYVYITIMYIMNKKNDKKQEMS